MDMVIANSYAYNLKLWLYPVVMVITKSYGYHQLLGLHMTHWDSPMTHRDPPMTSSDPLKERSDRVSHTLLTVLQQH